MDAPLPPPPPPLRFVGPWGRLKLLLGPSTATTARQMLLFALVVLLGARCMDAFSQVNTARTRLPTGSATMLSRLFLAFVAHPLLTQPRLLAALRDVGLGRRSRTGPPGPSGGPNPPGLRFELSSLRGSEAQARAARLLSSPAFCGRGESAAAVLRASCGLSEGLLPATAVLLEIFAAPPSPLSSRAGEGGRRSFFGRRKNAAAAPSSDSLSKSKTKTSSSAGVSPPPPPQPNRLLALAIAYVEPRAQLGSLLPSSAGRTGGSGGGYGGLLGGEGEEGAVLCLHMGPLVGAAMGATLPAWFPLPLPPPPPPPLNAPPSAAGGVGGAGGGRGRGGEGGMRHGILLSAACARLCQELGCVAALLPPEPAGLPQPLQRLTLLSRGAHPLLSPSHGAPGDTHVVFIPETLRGRGDLTAFLAARLGAGARRDLRRRQRKWGKGGGRVRTLAPETLAELLAEGGGGGMAGEALRVLQLSAEGLGGGGREPNSDSNAEEKGEEEGTEAGGELALAPSSSDWRAPLPLPPSTPFTSLLRCAPPSPSSRAALTVSKALTALLSSDGGGGGEEALSHGAPIPSRRGWWLFEATTGPKHSPTLAAAALLRLDTATGTLCVARSWLRDVATPSPKQHSGASTALATACLQLALALPRVAALELGALSAPGARHAARFLSAVALPRTPLLYFADDRMAAQGRMPQGGAAHALPVSLTRGMLAAARVQDVQPLRVEAAEEREGDGRPVLLTRRQARRALRKGKRAERKRLAAAAAQGKRN